MPRAIPSRVKTRRRHSGQATVEFGLVVGIFLILFLGIVDLGRLMAMHSAAVTASREAARYGSAVGDNGSGTLRYVDCAGIRLAARKVTGSIATLSDAAIEITYDNGDSPPTAATAACPPVGAGPVANDIDRFDRVVVKVTLTYEAISPVRFLLGPITVVSIDRRAIAKAS